LSLRGFARGGGKPHVNWEDAAARTLAAPNV
jgi:hypothetical protein